MRAIILAAGSLAGAAVLTALAVLVQPESPIWKWLLWLGISVFTACACILIIDYSRPDGRMIFLLGMGAGIALFIASAIAFYVEQPSGLQIGALVNNAEYPSGTMVSDIKFKPEFTEATITIANASRETYEDISLLFQFDEAIAAISQTSNVPNVSFNEKNGMGAKFMLSDPATGKTIVVPSIELLATDVGYIMRCSRLSAETRIRVWTQLIQKQRAVTRQTAARKLRASLS